ncbi:MAG: hypothetical protein ACM3KE_01185 [Hyphomicrobiales bacterium]
MLVEAKSKMTNLAFCTAGAIGLGILVTSLVGPILAEEQNTLEFTNKPSCGFEFFALEVPPCGRQPIPIPDELERTIREATAYNVGDPAQTDESPCLTADGSNACEELAQGRKICAANFVPIGTRLLIKGLGTCTVKDRMNSRFKNRVDIAMPAHEKERARQFGLQKVEVRILE